MKSIRLLILTITGLVVGSVYAVQLTQDQQTKLQNLGDEFAKKSTVLEAKLDARIAALETELTREGRLGSEDAAATSAKQANAIVKEIGGLSGDVIKTQIEFVLKAKNMLTPEQREHLLEELVDAAVVEQDDIEFLEIELLELPIDLGIGQRRKLIELHAVAGVDAVRAERDASLILLDLEKALFADEVDSDAVDKLVTRLGDLAVKVINTRVDHFLKAKDVLTLEQKQSLLYLFLNQ